MKHPLVSTKPHAGRRLRSAFAAGLVVALSLVSAAGSAAATSVPSGHISWTACPKVSGYQCGTLRVPLDYSHPSRGSVSLAVIERPVVHSKGVIVFNPGGPGESGVLILPILASLMPQAVQDDFTFASFDERGTGASEPLLCGPSAAEASSAIPGTASDTRTFADLARSCRAKYPALFPTVNTTTSAHDMDQLRAALGVKTIDFYGQSYGTVLGSVYAQLYPSHIRSMVLDGAVDTNLSLVSDAKADAVAMTGALLHELNACLTTPGCPLGADGVGTYLRVQKDLSAAPLPAPGNGDTTPVTAGDLYTASLLYLSAPNFTPGYFPALAAAAAGNGAPLRSVALGLENDLNGESLVGPLWTITCSDVVAHPDAQTTARLANTLANLDPMIGAEAVSNYLVGCPGWGTSVQPVAHLAPHGGPPPLVIGNVYDPNTPYSVAPKLAAATGGRLVTYVGYGHTWLLNGSKNDCMRRIVSSYFVEGVVPADHPTCTASP